MLRTICVFQKSVVQALTSLHRQKSPLAAFERFVQEREPMLSGVKNQVQQYAYDVFRNNFDKRLNDVINWIEECRGSI